jgi:hypothetical protein
MLRISKCIGPLQTGKDEYDASTNEDQKQSFAAGSVFQGLRADLDG